MEEPIQRPRLLAVICILTFLGSGMALFSNAMLWLFYDQFRNLFSTQESLNFLGSQMDIKGLLDLSRNFYLLQALFDALSLTGAIMMWNFRKIGFHFYVTAQLVLLIIPKLYIHGLPFPAFELSLTALFIYLYYKHLDLMH
jgi:hypothetical protein